MTQQNLNSCLLAAGIGKANSLKVKRHLFGCLLKKIENFFISFLYKQENVQAQKPWKEPVAAELLSPI